MMAVLQRDSSTMPVPHAWLKHAIKGPLRCLKGTFKAAYKYTWGTEIRHDCTHAD